MSRRPRGSGAIRAAKGRQFQAPGAPGPSYIALVESRHLPPSRRSPPGTAASALALTLLIGVIAPSSADEPTQRDGALALQVQSWVQSLASSLPELPQARVEVQVGSLDRRLRLAPCEQVETYMPSNSRPWGRTRVGLRCLRGPSHWNVFLPVTVRLWAPAPVLRQPRPAGYELQEADFIPGETDWAAQREAPLAQPAMMVGRALSQPLGAGQPVRASQLRRRQWFAAGDTVRVIARGQGYSVSGEAQALTQGLDGESVRVRTAAGRIITGTAVAAHRVEIPL